MSITVVPGPTLNLNVTDATSTVDLTVQTTPSFTLEFQAGQGPAGIGLPAGGFTDQVLAKNSNTSGDVSWKYVSPASVGLGNVDNTSDMDKPVSTAQQTAIDGAKSYADGLVVGLWDDRGSFDASVNTYPTSGGSGPSGVIKKGDVWTITVAATSGPLLGHSLGSTVRALADTPAQVDANWSVIDTGFSAATSGANSNITSLSGITGGISTADYLDFDTTAAATPAVGRLHWDANERGPAVTMAGGNVLLQIGQETVVNIFNNTGSALSDGQVVYCTGSQGQRLTVALARADSEVTSETILGVVTEPIANNAEGFITVQGTVHGLNTTGFADGAKLYISPTTAGLLTATEPVAPDHSVSIGFVVKGGSAGAGSIYVQVQAGYELDELHDVKVTSVAGGDVLTYDNAIPAWKNVTKANSGLARDGAVTGSGLTMATARLLGRTTAATGGVEEISVGSGLSLSAGTLSASASATLTISNKTGAYTVVAGDNGSVINCTSGTFTVSLTAAATLGAGFNVEIFNSGTGVVTVDPNGTETLDGSSTSVTLGQGNSVNLYTDSTGWFSRFGRNTGLGTTQYRSIQIGARSQATGTASIALGYLAAAGGGSNGGIAIGAQASASGSSAVSVGASASATVNYAVAIGSNSAGQASQAVTGAGAMALGGSYASGTDSFAAAIGNNTSSYGAQGSNSVAIGSNAKATTASSLALGTLASVTGGYSIAISTGYNAGASATGTSAISIGDGSAASGNSSVAVGSFAVASIVGKYAYASGRTSASGDAQLGAMILRGSTTDATPTAITSNSTGASSNNQLVLPNDSSYTFTGSVIARNTATDTESKAWTFFGAIRRGAAAANTALIGTPGINIVGADSGTTAWTFTLTADTTNGGLAVTVTGEAAKTLRWVCRIDTVEVSG